MSLIPSHSVSLLKKGFFITVFYIICTQNFVFPSSPNIHACSPEKWHLFPCSLEINGLVPLFPKTPGRASIQLFSFRVIVLLCHLLISFFIKIKFFEISFRYIIRVTNLLDKDQVLPPHCFSKKSSYRTPCVEVI